MRKLRSRLTFANVCSFLALLIALGTGGAYAADTIGSSDIIDESILSQDIKNNEVASGDVKNNAIRSPDVHAETLTGADIIEGSLATVPNADTLDGKDSKDFARLGGVVTSDGSVFQGSGYTVSHPAVGVYEVSFPSGTLSNCPPIATAMVFTGLIETSGRLCSGLGAGSVTFTTVDNDGVAHNSPFVFMGM